MNDGLYPDWKKWQSWVWMVVVFAVLIYLSQLKIGNYAP